MDGWRTGTADVNGVQVYCYAQERMQSQRKEKLQHLSNRPLVVRTHRPEIHQSIFPLIQIAGLIPEK